MYIKSHLAGLVSIVFLYICFFFVINHLSLLSIFFFFNDPAPTEIYTLSLHDALPISEAGAITGHIHLIGGILATAGAAWLMSRPSMVDPHRVLRLLAWVTGCATIPSIMAYWTDSLWLARVMFWAYIPAIYFFIGPCMALVLNLAPSIMRSTFTAWSVLVGNVFNLIVAPQFVGFLSDTFGGTHGADAASLRWALLVLAPTGFWATWHFVLAGRTVVPDMQRAVSYAA